VSGLSGCGHKIPSTGSTAVDGTVFLTLYIPTMLSSIAVKSVYDSVTTTYLEYADSQPCLERYILTDKEVLTELQDTVFVVSAPRMCGDKEARVSFSPQGIYYLGSAKLENFSIKEFSYNSWTVKGDLYTCLPKDGNLAATECKKISQYTLLSGYLPYGQIDAGGKETAIAFNQFPLAAEQDDYSHGSPIMSLYKEKKSCRRDAPVKEEILYGFYTEDKESRRQLDCKVQIIKKIPRNKLADFYTTPVDTVEHK
jgi:hypothetical protein